MVSLASIQVSNAQITSKLQGLVAVFVGATSGIGEASLKAFAKNASRPRAYFVGRNQGAATRIISECKALNPSGHFEFIQSDISLIRNVDSVCKTIAARAKSINILFLSQGVIELSRRQTAEKIDVTLALTYFTRMRFITNLLPLLWAATTLKRVVVVFAGTKEGPIFADDYQCNNVSILKIASIRGHMCSMIDFGMESIAKNAPEVGFVHDYPGFVKTNIFEKTPGVAASLIRTISQILPSNEAKYIPIEECGERHLYLATSSRYDPSVSPLGIPLSEHVAAATGSDGQVGSGVYIVDEECESASREVVELLDGMRKVGTREKVWEHTQEEWRRIAGSCDARKFQGD